MNTDKLYFIQCLVIFQTCFLVFLVLFAYCIKAIISFLQERQRQFITNTKALIIQNQHFSPKLIQRFSKNPKWLLGLIQTLDETPPNEHWQHLRLELLTNIILPCARKWAFSSRWSNRYDACQALNLHSETHDIKIINHLIKDSVPLIAIHATAIAFKYDSQVLVDTIIRIFSMNRRLQYALFTQTMRPKPSAIPLIIDCLNRSTDAYAKVLCYKLLTTAPSSPEAILTLHDDLEHPNRDLKIASTRYLSLANPARVKPYLLQQLQDPEWEVRSQAAKVAGDIHEFEAIPLLTQCLRDENWWVRINAATALFHLGDEGMQILMQQNQDHDRFAYDAAQWILATTKEPTSYG